MANPTTIASVPVAVRTPIALSIQRSLPPFSLPVPALDFNNGQTASISASAFSSSIFDASNDRVVEITCNVDCFYTVGPSASSTASAVSGSTFLAAGSLRYVYVGAGNIISVTQSTATGSLYMIPTLIPSYVG